MPPETTMATPHEVIMPALGMAQDTGLIVAWHKGAGDTVSVGDVLFEVETDKATMEVEAQADGILGDIRADAGDEVPVGTVIAVIGDTVEAAQGDGPAASAAPLDPEMPEGNSVIMPALGMAQDTGLIVAWHKEPGDAVASGDVLFEVETDKSTVEVEAGFDGFVAALLAGVGEEAPVGETIAVIADRKPENPVHRSRAAGPKSAPKPTPKSAPASATPAVQVPKPAPVAKVEAPVSAVAPPSPTGRILASPKARRLALEQGLDLNRLVEAGYRQPFHVADIEVLKSLPAQTPGTPAAAARRLTAEVASDAFSEFSSWAADAAGLGDANALLAGFAGASLGREATIAVEGVARARVYSVPAGSFGTITETDAAPDLCLRDLRLKRITSVALGAEDTPVLTLTGTGNGLTLTLECADHHLTASEAVDLLANFAGRMEQPLRHLL